MNNYTSVQRRSSTVNDKIQQILSDENIEGLDLNELTFKFCTLQSKYNSLLQKQQEYQDQISNTKQQLELYQNEVQKIPKLTQKMQQAINKFEQKQDEIENLKQQNEQLKIQQLSLNEENNQNHSNNNISLSAFYIQKDLQEKQQQLQQALIQKDEIQQNYNILLTENNELKLQQEKQSSLLIQYSKLNTTLQEENQIIKTENNNNLQLINQLKHQIEKNHENHIDNQEFHQQNTLLQHGIIIEEKETEEEMSGFEKLYQSYSTRNSNISNRGFNFQTIKQGFIYYLSGQQFLIFLQFVI